MKKTLPDEVFYFMMISLETKEMHRLKWHRHLHLSLGRLSAGFDLHGNHIIDRRKKRKRGRKEREGL
jgi:hypothetical protein